jgi:N-acetyl-gamma-glutamyl-phosphate reductase
VFSALPHGEAAGRIDGLLEEAAAAGCEARVVDLSADFRHRDPARYAALYGKPHAAPARLGEFLCAVPEHVQGMPASRHVAHPGCFTTAATLALVPLLAAGLIEPRATVVAVTGSTGAGRAPTPTTHHPERRSDLFAYAAAGHRHEPEMRALAAAAAGNGQAAEPAIHFVPQSGPFARGIHATVSARLTRRSRRTRSATWRPPSTPPPPASCGCSRPRRACRPSWARTAATCPSSRARRRAPRLRRPGQPGEGRGRAAACSG